MRKEACKKPTPTVAIIDSQSVKTTAICGPERGYDAGKKVKGRKRHIVVDMMGLLLAVVVNGVHRQNQDGACLVLKVLWKKMKRIRKIFGDTAYGRKGLPEFAMATFGFAIEIVKRPKDVKGFKVLPKRWIVERTFAWLGWPAPQKLVHVF